ncbi:MAG: hypothetical protein V7642_3728 [Burkholderiales bacterium]
MKLKMLTSKSDCSLRLLHPAAIRRRRPYSGRGEHLKHLLCIRDIAQETNRSEQEVATVYENVLMDLKLNARVHDFLPIFVAKKVKDRLRNAQR